MNNYDVLALVLSHAITHFMGRTSMKYNMSEQTKSRFETLESNFKRNVFHTNLTPIISFLNKHKAALNFIQRANLIASSKHVLAKEALSVPVDGFKIHRSVLKGYSELSALSNQNAVFTRDYSLFQEGLYVSEEIRQEVFRSIEYTYFEHSKNHNLDAPLLEEFSTEIGQAWNILDCDETTLHDPVSFYRVFVMKYKDDPNISFSVKERLESYPQVQKLLVMQ